MNDVEEARLSRAAILIKMSHVSVKEDGVAGRELVNRISNPDTHGACQYDDRLGRAPKHR